MNEPLRLLIVEDYPDDAELMVMRLEEEGFKPEWKRVETEEEFIKALEDKPEFILADWALPQFSGLRALELINERGLDIPLILVSGSIGEEAAISALHLGASDYILKDRSKRLGQAVRRTLDSRRYQQEKEEAETELKRRLAELEMLYNISSSLRYIESLDALLKSLLGQTLSALNTDTGSIWLTDSGNSKLRMLSASGWFTELDSLEVEPGEGLVGETYLLGEPSISPEFASDPRLSKKTLAETPAGWGGALVPLHSNEKNVGVMLVAVPLPREVTANELKMLSSIAEMAGIAIHRIALYQETVTSLQIETAIAEISAKLALTTVKEVDRDLNYCLKKIGQLADVDRCYIFQTFGNGTYFRNTHEWCAKDVEPQIDLLQRVPTETQPWTLAKFYNNEIVSIPDVSKMPVEAAAEKQLFESLKIPSLIMVPMFKKNELIGFIGFDAIRKPGIWAEKHLLILKIAVNIIGGFMGNMRIETQLAIADKLAAIGQLSAGIAHEINSPMQFIADNTRFLRDSFPQLLNSIEKFKQSTEITNQGDLKTVDPIKLSKLLKDTLDSHLVQEIPLAIEQNLEGISKITQLVNSMRQFSFFNQKEKKFADINQIIRDSVVLTRNEWRHCARLNTDLDDQLPPYKCFINELGQVFLNIIINAAYAIRDKINLGVYEEGIIEIKTMATDQAIIISVKDNGIGIPEIIRHRIFDAFFTTREVGQGTGQGLMIAHEIIYNKHEGTIDVETEEMQGTTFRIILPMK